MPQNQFTIPAKTKGVILPGWILTPYDRIVIRWISGYWTCNPNVPPPQYDGNGNSNYKAKPGYLLPGSNEGCLVAAIGNPAISKWTVGNFAIVGGDGKSAGQLWVACNDDWNGTYGAGYNDNTGQITIQVFVLSEYLNQLSDEKEMQEFVNHFGNQIGIDSIEKLKQAIQEKDKRLLEITTKGGIESAGEKI